MLTQLKLISTIVVVVINFWQQYYKQYYSIE